MNHKLERMIKVKGIFIEIMASLKALAISLN